jgi:hypothetical protein
MCSDVCNHGSLRRSCEICERDGEIVRLKAALRDAERVEQVIVTAGLLSRDTFDRAHEIVRMSR